MSAAVRRPAATESTVSWLPHATSAGIVTLAIVAVETPWMPWPSSATNADAVPATRNGRCHASMNASVNGGDSSPQALRRPRRKSQSEPVAMRYALVNHGGTSRWVSQAPPLLPGSASPSRRTIPDSARGVSVATETATAAPREWPTSTGRRMPSRRSNPSTSSVQRASVYGPRRCE